MTIPRCRRNGARISTAIIVRRRQTAVLIGLKCDEFGEAGRTPAPVGGERKRARRYRSGEASVAKDSDRLAEPSEKFKRHSCFASCPR